MVLQAQLELACMRKDLVKVLFVHLEMFELDQERVVYQAVVQVALGSQGYQEYLDFQVNPEVPYFLVRLNDLVIRYLHLIRKHRLHEAIHRVVG